VEEMNLKETVWHNEG